MPVPRPAQECPDTQLAMQDFTTRGRAGSCPREDALAPVQALLRILSLSAASMASLSATLGRCCAA